MDRIKAGEGLRLPSLAREELLTLGSPRHPLIGAAEARWLAELDDAKRREASAAGAASLGARGLVTRSGDGIAMRPELEVLLALRRSPALVVVAADDDATTSSSIQMYVGAHASGEVVAVLAERLVEKGHAFLLCTPEAAVRELTSWAVRPPGGGSISGTLGGAEETLRTVDVYHPAPEAWLGYRVAIASSPEKGVTIREGTVGEELSLPMSATDESLGDALRRALTPLRAPGPPAE